jgi:hypothetical protein
MGASYRMQQKTQGEPIHRIYLKNNSFEIGKKILACKKKRNKR